VPCDCLDRAIETEVLDNIGNFLAANAAPAPGATRPG
jgi:hypothetical protein